jgi:hypothetical protein
MLGKYQFFSFDLLFKYLNNACYFFLLNDYQISDQLRGFLISNPYRGKLVTLNKTINYEINI